jgi:von Willebrand factor type A domain
MELQFVHHNHKLIIHYKKQLLVTSVIKINMTNHLRIKKDWFLIICVVFCSFSTLANDFKESMIDSASKKSSDLSKLVMFDTSSETHCINEQVSFTFETTGTNMNYVWSTNNASGQVLDSSSSNSTGQYAYTFTIPGNYVIKLTVTDSENCSKTFTKEIVAVNCNEETSCTNETINLSFESTSTNIIYNWYTVKNGTTQQFNPVTDTTGLYSFTPTTSGSYTIHLSAYENDQCTYEFTKTVTVNKCAPFVSCTKSNPNTPTIKSIFTTLANKLINLPSETIINGYTCDELKALAFYIKEENPSIYNFVHNTQEGFIAFSFGNHTDYDVKIATNGNHIAEFNLDNYESNEIVTYINTTPSSNVESYINHVDFCSGLYCVDHIAIVLDESGSISLEQAAKIKKQLKRYIQQQADDNDKLQSNIYVSLTGMSDSDSVTRTDNISPKRLTNTDPDSLRMFNNWIDNYRTRSGDGISASSDYWKTALDVALNSAMKPNVVLMITDGCETNDVEKLKDQTMARFSNSKSIFFTNSDKPHLYVIGIANGFYVDGGITGGSLARSADPNYVQTLAAETSESRVVPVLRTSLKYLLSFGETEYPTDKIDDFRSDFYGFENFDSLGTLENEAFLSDNLKLSKFSCGLPTDKNYCTDCLSFQPIPNKEYMLSAWVKEDTAIQLKTYENAVINVVFFSNVDTNDIRYRIGIESFTAKGDIIDGWQRITSKFLIPEQTRTIGIELENKSDGIPVYFDDIRIHPIDGSVKTFVYDAETFKLMSELDENNYSTFYEYDNEGGLVRIKKETAKGVKTIQETRSGNFINNN